MITKTMKLEFWSKIAISVAMTMATTQSHAQYTLWYDEPARVWTDALPLGNGRLGAMVFGSPATDRIQLNEETIWAGQPNNNANPNAREAIPKIQQLIWQRRYQEAQDMATEKVMSQTNHGMPYQTFGSVYISTPATQGYTAYRRELSLDSAVATTTYTVRGVTYRRETTVSMADQVVRVRLTASKPRSITFTAHFASPHDDVIIASEADEATLLGVSSKHEGLKGKVRFMGRMAAKARRRGADGRLKDDPALVESRDGIINVDSADEATIYISIATNFKNYRDITGDEAQLSEHYLRTAMSHDDAEARAEHIRRFQHYMGRTRLWLGPDLYAQEPTDRRLMAFAGRDDNHLVATYFMFGRYLLISSSQPGGQPANLQGIWNDKLLPSWDSKYTVNINTEMNYWPAEPTRLSELAEPLFRMIGEVAETGRETARTMYGKEGWVLHHNTDLWRVTGGIDKAASGMWMMGGAWLSDHLWQHYLYTGDTATLRRHYPIIEGAARFIDQMLVTRPGTDLLMVSPSVSPENIHPVVAPSDPTVATAPKAAIAAGTAMDTELTASLFATVARAARILGIDTTLAAHYTERARRLAPLHIGRWGQLQEWDDDWDDPHDEHRHVSHLYGLYPGNLISARRTPELASAARTSLIHRGDPSTGWSMGWKVCLWAHLLDGNHAYKLIRDQLTLTDDRFLAYGTTKKRGGTYRNLFDAHPPFQIDGNFGCTAGIAEMLVQSSDGCVDLLPALPDAWRHEGRVEGLATRGGFVIEEMAWRDGRIISLRIRSTLGGNLRISVPRGAIDRKALRHAKALQHAKALRHAKTLGQIKVAKGANPNPLFDVPAVPRYDNLSKVRIAAMRLPAIETYDIATRKGEMVEVGR